MPYQLTNIHAQSVVPMLSDEQKSKLAKVQLPEDWKEALAEELLSENMDNLRQFVRQEYTTKTIYPPLNKLFEAFNLTPLHKLKVVILGQDPYHGAGQAMGLAFSVPKVIPKPPSLNNIFKELSSDMRLPISPHGDLTAWARQGVLLLNSVLTVEAGRAASHQHQGWEQFTDAVIGVINERTEGTVFILWGAYAKQKGRYIDTERHLVLSANHPSPLSANRGGFFGSRPFSCTNQYLIAKGKTPINWQL